MELLTRKVVLLMRKIQHTVSKYSTIFRHQRFLVFALVSLVLLTFVSILYTPTRSAPRAKLDDDGREECPSTFTSFDIAKLLPRHRIEEVSGGHVPEMLSDNRPLMKVLFIVFKQEYDIRMSRWYYQVIEAARSIPYYDTYVWGEGYYGYNRICSCVDAVKGKVFVVCPRSETQKVEEQATLLAGRSEEAKAAFDKLPQYTTECANLNLATFVDHITVLFSAESKPFDAICFSRESGTIHTANFTGLNPSTVTVLMELEWHDHCLKRYRDSEPGIVLTAYIDHAEENFPMRDFMRRKWWGSENKDVKEYDYGALQNNVTQYGPDVLFGHFPNTILPQCSSNWTAHLGTHANEYYVNQKRTSNIALVGVVGVNYPTREIFKRMVHQNFFGIREHVRMRDHPGYYMDETPHPQDVKTQFHDYMRLLEQTKICFIGVVSTWTVRKYKEAMAAGCLAVGDIPADHYLAKYVVNVDIIPPGYFNFDEDLDVIAANEASSAQFGNLTNWWCSEAECDKTLEGERSQHVWNTLSPYDVVKTDHLTMTRERLLAQKLLWILSRYEKGEYNTLINEARRTVLTEYSSQQMLTTWFEPAIAAWRRGERGWLRTPAYFQDSYKYRARHYFLLREWLLRREGSSVVPKLENITYGGLLKWASHRLREDARAECLRNSTNSSSRQLLDCDDPSWDYFPNMVDFDIAFVKSRKLYSQEYALDRFSHMRTYHMHALYVPENRSD